MLWKHCSSSMPSVIALLWVNYVLSFSTMACAIFDLTSPIRDRSSKNPSSATSVSSLLSSSLGAYGSLLLQRSSTSMFLCVRLLKLSSSSATCLRASSSSSATRSTSYSNCCELVDRPERRFRSIARVRLLASSLSSGTTRVVLINNCYGNFDLTSAIRDRSSKVEM